MGGRISVSIKFGGSAFPIEDLPSNTKIVALKREIFQFTGIFINNQVLKFMGRVLEDRQTLVECGIKTAAIIELEERAEDSRKIFIESTNGNNLMTLDYDPNDTILKIKIHFLRDLNIPIERQKLYFTTVLLQDGEKLSKYKIEEGTKLTLEVTQLNPNCIMVEMPNGQVLDLDYEENLTIDNLKQTISCKIGDIEADRIRLYFKEEHLESRKSLSRCNVKVGDTLKLKLREGEEIIIFIDAPTVKQEMRNLTPERTIADIKHEILQEADILIERQALYLEDKLLQNETTLSQAGIEDGSRIKLVLEGLILMKIFVKFNSRDIEVEVESKSTVLKLKEIIEEKIGIKVKVQKLIFAGKLLEDAKQLSFYGVQKESAIYLIQQFDREEIQIIIKTNNDIEYPISVLPNTRISEIKERISLKEHGAPDQYQLTFSGTILTDQTTVSNYEIQNMSILHMELMRDDTAPALPVRMRSRSHTIRGDSARISNLYVPQEEDLNIDSPEMFQAVLPPYMHIPVSSRDNSTDRPNSPYEPITVDIVTPPINHGDRDDNKEISFSSPHSANSENRPNQYDELVERYPQIQDRRDLPDPPFNPELYSPRAYQNIPPPHFREFPSYRPVETTSYPSPYVGDVMKESCKILNEISVRVTIVCGGEYTFEFGDKATIRDVKKKIQSERDCKPEYQKVYFRDCLCEDTHTLVKVGIVEQSIIVVDLLRAWNVSFGFGRYPMVVKCYAKSNIGDIKECIYRIEKIEIEKQRIYLDERELRNEQSLSDYLPGPNLRFILGLNKNISVIFSSGKTFILSSSQKLTGLLIKQQIKSEFKIPVENQTLTYIGKEIKNELTLEAIKFREEDHITVAVNSEGSRLITILVRLSTGEQKIVKISSLETVGKIKSLIYNTNHTFIDDHDFRHRHSSLSDENVLEYYGIRNYDEIQVFSNDFKVISVTLLEGNTEPFCLKAFQTQEEMLAQIRKQFRLPPEYNGLFFDKRRNFHLQAISPGDNLYLGFKDSILVSVAPLSSRVIQILVNREDRVTVLKRKIKIKENIPINVQELIFCGLPMNDYASIGEFNLMHPAIITLRVTESALNYISIYLTDENNNSVCLTEVNRYGTVTKLSDSLVGIGYTVQRDELFVFKDSVLHSDAPLCYYGIHSGNELRLISPSTPNCLDSIREEFKYRPRSDRKYRDQYSKTVYKSRSTSCLSCNRVECECTFRPHSATLSDTISRPIQRATSGFKLRGNSQGQQWIPQNMPIDEDVVLPFTDYTHNKYC